MSAPATAREEPRFLDLDTLHFLHARQVERFGGLPGVRDRHSLEVALARARMLWVGDASRDAIDLAAAYANTLSRQHGYLDGNKRVALAAALVTLERNGWTLRADPDDLFVTMSDTARGDLTMLQLSEWMRERCAAIQ